MSGSTNQAIEEEIANLKHRIVRASCGEKDPEGLDHPALGRRLLKAQLKLPQDHPDYLTAKVQLATLDVDAKVKKLNDRINHVAHGGEDPEGLTLGQLKVELDKVKLERPTASVDEIAERKRGRREYQTL